MLRALHRTIWMKISNANDWKLRKPFLSLHILLFFPFSQIFFSMPIDFSHAVEKIFILHTKKKQPRGRNSCTLMCANATLVLLPTHILPAVADWMLKGFVTVFVCDCIGACVYARKAVNVV